MDGWDQWYRSIPDDLLHRLSIHDFRRLGACFKTAFSGGDIPKKFRMKLSTPCATKRLATASLPSLRTFYSRCVLS